MEATPESGQAPESGQKSGQNQPDPMENIKAEFQRKFSNVSDEISQLKQTNQALVDLLKGQKAAPKAEPEEDLTSMIYDKPHEFIEKVVEKVSSKVDSRLETRSRVEQERVQVLNSLTMEFPELSKPGSEFYNEAVKALETLPKEVQSTALGYKTAVYQAAASMGIQPSSKRGRKPDEGQEDFSFSGAKSGGTKKDKKPDIDPKILMTAELMGEDVSDPKVIEELKKYSKRQYGRYE